MRKRDIGRHLMELLPEDVDIRAQLFPERTPVIACACCVRQIVGPAAQRRAVWLGDSRVSGSSLVSICLDCLQAAVALLDAHAQPEKTVVSELDASDLAAVGLVDANDVPGIRIRLRGKWAADLHGDLADHFIASCSAALADAMGRAEAIAAARRASQDR